MLVSIGFSYEGQIWFWRFASWILPIVIGWITYRVCRELRASGSHPLRGWSGRFFRRNAAGGFETVAVPTASRDPSSTDRHQPPPTYGTTPGER